MKATALIERSEEEEIQRGREAAHLKEHPMVVGALDAIEAYYSRVWKDSKLGENQVREEAFRMLHCVALFGRLLTDHMETGTLAEKAKVIRDEQEALIE